MTDERFKFNGANNCIEYDNESILLDSYGEDIAELLNELHEENKELKKVNAQFDILIKNNQLAYIDLKKENEQLKQQLKSIDDNFELNWYQNYVEFDKDKLEIKDVHTKIYLNGTGLLIEVYIPQIDEYYRFKYYVTGRNLMDRFIREYHSKGDVE